MTDDSTLRAMYPSMYKPDAPDVRGEGSYPSMQVADQPKARQSIDPDRELGEKLYPGMSQGQPYSNPTADQALDQAASDRPADQSTSGEMPAALEGIELPANTQPDHPLTQEFVKIIKGAGINPDAAQKMVDLHQKATAQREEVEHKAFVNQLRRESEADVVLRGGGLERARSFWNANKNPEVERLFEDSGLANSRELLRWLASLELRYGSR